MIGGGNVATILLMLFAGYADLLPPQRFPLLACMGLAFPGFLIVNMAFLVFWLIFKPRLSLLPIIGVLLVLPPLQVYCPIHVKTTPPSGTIKVLSYNVQAYSGHPRYDDAFDMIYGYFVKCDADIVCLQEDMDTWRNAKVRMDSLYAYSDTVRFGRTPFFNAIGIYSRYPILKKERIHYTSRANGSVAYFLSVKGDTVIVINNHLESNHLSLSDREKYSDMLKGEVDKDSARAESRKLLKKLTQAVEDRAPQADSVAAYIRAHRHLPIILCGDFNDNPISYVRRTIAKELTDCYVETGRGPGISYNQKGFYVRIDNIFCSSHFVPYNSKVDSKIDASDHYPIYCWLKLSPKTVKNKENK